MSDVFKLVITAAVFIVLLYFVLTLFVLPKTNFYPSLTNSVKSAMLQPGVPVCDKITLPKNTTILTNIILERPELKDLSMFLWFSKSGESANPQISLAVNDAFVLKSDSGLAGLDFCSVCYPGFLFSDVPELATIEKDFFCQIVFGKQLFQLQLNFPPVQDSVKQGALVLPNTLTNLPESYNYYLFLISKPTKQTITLSDLAGLKMNEDTKLESVFKFSAKELQSKQNITLTFPNTGPKIIVQAVVGENRNPYNGIILPAKFSVVSTEVLPNIEYQSQGCTATTSEKQYKNFTKNKCVVYNKCEGCSLPTYCADAWKVKGIDAESKTKNYAISYLPIDECP